MYTELIIGKDSYKLRLSTKRAVDLERALGFNPLQIFFDVNNGKLPKLSDLMIMLQYFLQDMQHGIKLEDAYDIYDKFVAEGHNMFDLIPLFIEVLKESGFMAEEVDESKNA
jgi:hypothetical protein